MRKFLRFFILTILCILILGITYFLLKWNKINIDNNIGNSIEIKNLNNKVFDQSFLIFDSTIVKTDFEIFETKHDIVTFNFNANKSPNNSNITILNFNSGDGFSGVNLSVIKYRKYFFPSIESYTDVKRTFDFLESNKYTIKKSKLFLDKSEYNKGDSIFGKIELEIKFNPNDSIYHSKGYFKSVVD